MKKYILLFAVLMAFISCESTEVVEDTEFKIVGDWKLTDFNYEMTQINIRDVFGEIRHDTSMAFIEVFDDSLIAEFKYNPQFLVESGDASYVYTRIYSDGDITKDTVHYENIMAGGEWNYVNNELHLWIDDDVRIGTVSFSGDKMFIDVDMESSTDIDGDYEYKREILQLEYQEL
ncbi:hypothetical protein [Mangrovivirga cuniculi]|nr:hypothetical protein [Mangrovivirga cuniculi]